LSEQTTERTTGDNAALIADLTDLLQLEFDALPAYTVAIAGCAGARSGCGRTGPRPSAFSSGGRAVL
jgi:hypothetical protein